MIQLRHCHIEWTPQGAITTFNDGASYPAWAYDTDDYANVARRCGYGSGLYHADRLAYAREHEVCHGIVSEHLADAPCPVLRALAHGTEIDLIDAARTEALVQLFQRYLRAGEVPILAEGIDWHAMRAHALQVLL